MRILLVICCLILFIVIAANNNQTLSYTSGAPLETTNAPGETSCSTNSLCHTGAVNQGSAATIMTSMEDLSSGYIPGETYTLMPYIYQNGIDKVGFETVALFDNGEGAGMVSIISTYTQVYSSGNKEYVTHTTSGNTNIGMHDWMYEWTAPTTGSGTVTVYVAFVASNNDMASSGDSIYTDSLVIEENTSGINKLYSNEFRIKNIYTISSTEIIIEYYSQHYFQTSCGITNLKGQKMYSQELELQKGHYSASLNFPEIKSGGYIIELSFPNTNTRVSQKIFIL